MDAEVILGIAAPIILLLCFIGTAGYNKIMVKWRDIIGGVGTAWLVTMGILLSVVSVVGIVRAIIGAGAVNVTSLVLYIAIAVWGIYALIKAEKRCSTTGQKIMVPFVCFALAMGFGWRILLKIFMSLPMESGSSGGFPKHFYQNGKFYSLVNDYGTSALYRSEDGSEITLNRSQADSIPDMDRRDDID